MHSPALTSLITAGVDTHKNTHTAAALDASGRLIGNETFAASADGYIALVGWLRGLGHIGRVGIEGTGSYGSGLAGHLRAEHIQVVEVNRPNRQARRPHGKSDPADAEAAARATLAGDAMGAPKSQDGSVEIMRLIRLQRRSAIRGDSGQPSISATSARWGRPSSRALPTRHRCLFSPSTCRSPA